MGAMERELLGRAAREHRRALRRADEIAADDYRAVLSLGSAVLLHSIVEEDRLYPIHRLLDPSVREQLEAEHRAIGDGLNVLEELLAGQPSSPDLSQLSCALLERIRGHLERDERVLYQPLRKLAVLPV